MFFNICIYRIANPNNTKGWDNISQPQAYPFSYLINHISGKTEDKTVSEKVRFISQLDQEDQHAVYRIIDGMLTKNKFQTFFEQNLQPAK